MIIALGLAGGGCAGAGAAVTVERRAPPGNRADLLRIMTFNIRYGTAPDGVNVWAERRGLALQTIRDFDPVVLGLQEALRFQLDELKRAFPAFDEAGVGRDDGAEAGEYASILYDRRRLTPLEQGNFWLSDTPEVPGSMTWGNRYPRIVSWVRLADGILGATFYVFNTHWDHESQQARERGALLTRERIRARGAPADPILVTGDFNAGEDNPALELLRATPVFDTFRAVHPSAQNVGTYHSFRGERGGPKIDAVMASPGWQVVDAAIVHGTTDGGRYASDHFPVTATLGPPSR